MHEFSQHLENTIQKKYNEEANKSDELALARKTCACEMKLDHAKTVVK